MKEKNYMLKKVVLRGAMSIPLGISLGYLITVGISLVWGQGYYAPCVPELAEAMGSEIRAVVLQTILYAVVGVAFGAGSVIWETESWSIARQTGTYFLLSSAVYLPTAYLLRWMERSLEGFLRFFGIFAAIFVLIWLMQLFAMSRHIKRMNERLKREKQGEDS